MFKNHAFFMAKALSLAQSAYEEDEVPVGALVVDEETGSIIAEASNESIKKYCALYHAEILAIERACIKVGQKKLPNYTLYVTLEPCTMCAGAIAHAGIKRLCFGAYDSKGGAVDHGVCFFDQETCHHKPEVIGGIMEEACAALLKSYFKNKRL